MGSTPELEGLELGQHACCRLDRDARRDAVATFITDGLARGERVAVLTDDPDEALPDLVGHGTPIDELRSRGQLMVGGVRGTGADPGGGAGAFEALVTTALAEG